MTIQENYQRLLEERLEEDGKQKKEVDRVLQLELAYFHYEKGNDTGYQEKKNDTDIQKGYDAAITLCKKAWGKKNKTPLAAYIIAKIYAAEKYQVNSSENRRSKILEWETKTSTAINKCKEILKSAKNSKNEDEIRQAITALYQLGVLYSTETKDIKGVNRDYKQAAAYYQDFISIQQKSQKQNILYKEIIQKRLGDLYYEGGYGLDQNYSQALNCYLEIKEPSEDVLYKIGFIYENGYNGSVDYIKAREYYEKAAASNNPDAFYKLGLFYSNDKYGFEKNNKKAKEYYEKSLEQTANDSLKECVRLALIELEQMDATIGVGYSIENQPGFEESHKNSLNQMTEQPTQFTKIEEKEILYKRLLCLSQKGDDAYIKAKNTAEVGNERLAKEFFRESKKHYKTILSFYDAKNIPDSIYEQTVDISKLRKRVIKIKMGKEFFEQHKSNCENYSSYLKDLYTELKSGTSDKRKWEELTEEFGEDWARDWFQKQSRAKPRVS